MKAKPPVIRQGDGRFKIDVLALREAIEKGTLSKEDRAVVEKVLPGICSKIEISIQAKKVIHRDVLNADPS